MQKIQLDDTHHMERLEQPFEDLELEQQTDYATMVYLRNGPLESDFMEGYGEGKGPHHYTVSDTRVRQDVCHALWISHEVEASKMDVEVQDHCVYLRGQVEDRVMGDIAEEIVSKVRGVLEVRNELTFLIAS
jgi:osmotically-inducible protein OsmY